MSPRLRVYIVTGAAALAAAGIAVGVAWTGRGEEAPAAGTAQGGPREGAPPLALDVLVGDGNEAAALRSAITLYEGGRRQAALSAFEDILQRDPGSLHAAVGAAFARWPDGTLARLEQLAAENPTSGLVRLHEGLALLWQGKDAEARAAWQEAERVNPDSPAAIRAESLLHPDMPAGRPFFVPSGPLPPELDGLPLLAQLDELERRAATATDAEPWIRYGAALQRAGRPISAREAFDRAVAVDPESVEAQTAAAVARFDKDDPSQAFSRLGPLSAQHPNDPVVRFHFGLGLLWLRGVDEAREQLEAAKASGAGTIYGREAAVLLERLSDASR